MYRFAKHRFFGPRYLWLRYVFAISLVVAMVSLTHVLQVSRLDTQSQFAEIINRSGQQRMLSQRIVLLAGDVAEATDAAHHDALDSAVSRFAQNHTWLTSGLAPDPTGAAPYSAVTQTQLDQDKTHFVSLARALLIAASLGETVHAQELHEALDEIGRDRLLNDLDAAVSFYEAKARASSSTLGTFQSIAFYSALALLLLEAAFIFYPAHRTVSDAMDQVETSARELRSLVSKLDRVAYTDDMTGIANRRAFFRHLTEDLGPKIRQGNTAVLFLLDLDGFKTINDLEGHKAGDHALQRVAAALTETAGPDDLVARLGGDEFAILHCTARASDAVAKAYADRLIKAVRGLQEAPARGPFLGASVGIRRFDGPHADLDTIVEDADLALYDAKARGKTAGRFTARICGVRPASRRSTPIATFRPYSPADRDA